MGLSPLAPVETLFVGVGLSESMGTLVVGVGLSPCGNLQVLIL